MARKIIHLDLDAFFCAVEELRNPALKGKAFAVGGRPEQRGVVASCSYAARQYGVHSAMPMGKALRLCPQLQIISARHANYGEVSETVMGILRRLTPQLEQVSIDEAFLDVSDLPDDPEQIARKLQSDIRRELDLPSSLGVASNKLVAKIANDAGKAARRSNEPPSAITVVPPGEEAAFLAPLPVEALWGVGPKTAARLAEIGILTIGDLAGWPERDLVHRFGKNGFDLAQHARGIDESPIVTFHEAKSISQEVTYARDVQDEKILKQTIQQLSDKVGKRLRQDALSGTTVKIKLRWPDFTTITRQSSFEIPVDQDLQIYQAAIGLFEKTWKPGQPVRLIGVGVSGLGLPIRQLSLWDRDVNIKTGQSTERERRLQEAIDELRERYGEAILQRGNKA
jgi:DNA polymerase-4